jgi:hypothetical protein
MPQLVEMDRHVTLFEQMEEQVGSVVLINTFTVEPEEADQLQERYRQMLWIRPHDHAAAFSSLPSTSSPFSNLAPALTNATK